MIVVNKPAKKVSPVHMQIFEKELGSYGFKQRIPGIRYGATVAA